MVENILLHLKNQKIDVTNQVLVFDNKVKINLNDINDIEIWKN